MSTLSIYSLVSITYSSVNSIYHVVPYIHNTHLFYNWKFHISLLPSSNSLTSGNHKSDFFLELVCFWSIIDHQHYVKFLLCKTMIRHLYTLKTGNCDI